MNMETLSSWIQLKANLLFVILCTQLLLSDSSPLSEDSRSDSKTCSKGWIHYQRFCVTQAKGESDAAIALYCDGFGGVGINGYCITKAHNTDSSVDSFQTSQEDSASSLGHELWRVADKSVVGENSKLGELMDGPRIVSDQYGDGVSVIEQQNGCPEGWTHYGKICVYQPLSVTEQCHHLNAVAFSGLCLKHADMDAVEKRGLKQSAAIMETQEKRICCCAHVRGKYNGYGCM